MVGLTYRVYHLLSNMASYWVSIRQSSGESVSSSNNHGSEKWLYLRGNYYYYSETSPFFHFHYVTMLNLRDPLKGPRKKPEYLITQSQLTFRGPLGFGPTKFLMDNKIHVWNMCLYIGSKISYVVGKILEVQV